jgi:hypothetical protein
LWVNLTGWLAPGARGDLPPSAVPGELVSFNLPEGVDAAEIRGPDGAVMVAQATDGRVTFSQTEALGYYQVRWGQGGQGGFAVNLFSQQESDLKPADALPGLESQSAGLSGDALRGMREWWRPLAFLALGLLVGEWLVYQRAAIARLRDWLKNLPQRKALPRIGRMKGE